MGQVANGGPLDLHRAGFGQVSPKRLQVSGVLDSKRIAGVKGKPIRRHVYSVVCRGSSAPIWHIRAYNDKAASANLNLNSECIDITKHPVSCVGSSISAPGLSVLLRSRRFRVHRQDQKPVLKLLILAGEGCTWLLFVDQERWPEIPLQFAQLDWETTASDFEDADKRNVIPMRIDLKELGYALFRATVPCESNEQTAKMVQVDKAGTST